MPPTEKELTAEETDRTAKLDAMTVEITTKEVDSFFPYQMLWFLVSSPAQYEKVGKDWKISSLPKS